MPEDQTDDKRISQVIGLAAAANVASNPANDPEIRALAEHVAGIIADEVKAEEAGA